MARRKFTPEFKLGGLNLLRRRGWRHPRPPGYWAFKILLMKLVNAGKGPRPPAVPGPGRV